MFWGRLEDEKLSVDASSLDYVEVYSVTIQLFLLYRHRYT